jgi:hypothetical protein
MPLIFPESDVTTSPSSKEATVATASVLIRWNEFAAEEWLLVVPLPLALALLLLPRRMASACATKTAVAAAAPLAGRASQ